MSKETRGADVPAPTKKQRFYSAIHRAGDRSETRTFLNSLAASYCDAAKSCDIEELRYLHGNFEKYLKYMPQVNSTTALHALAYQGVTDVGEDDRSATVDFLLEKFPNADLARDRDGNLPIHIAATGESQKTIEILCQSMSEKGRNIVQFNKYGDTALHKAAKKDNLDAAKCLVAAGISPDCKKKSKTATYLTPIEAAATSGSQEVLKHLLEKQNEIDSHGGTKSPFDSKKAIKTAYRKGDVATLSTLLAAGGDAAHLYALRKLKPEVKNFKRVVKEEFRNLVQVITDKDCKSVKFHLNRIDSLQNGAAIKSAVLNMHDQQHPLKYVLNAAYLSKKPDVFALLQDEGANVEIGRDHSLEMKKSKRPRASKSSKEKTKSETMYVRYPGRFQDFMERVEEIRRQATAESRNQEDALTTEDSATITVEAGSGGGKATAATSNARSGHLQTGAGKVLPPLRRAPGRVLPASGNQVSPADLSQDRRR